MIMSVPFSDHKNYANFPLFYKVHLSLSIYFKFCTVTHTNVCTDHHTHTYTQHINIKNIIDPRHRLAFND